MERSAIKVLARRGKSIRQIAAELGHSPTTIVRVLREPVDVPPTRRHRRSHVDPYRDQIRQWLAAGLRAGNQRATQTRRRRVGGRIPAAVRPGAPQPANRSGTAPRTIATALPHRTPCGTNRGTLGMPPPRRSHQYDYAYPAASSVTVICRHGVTLANRRLQPGPSPAATTRVASESTQCLGVIATRTDVFLG